MTSVLVSIAADPCRGTRESLMKSSEEERYRGRSSGSHRRSNSGHRRKTSSKKMIQLTDMTIQQDDMPEKDSGLKR